MRLSGNFCIALAVLAILIFLTFSFRGPMMACVVFSVTLITVLAGVVAALVSAGRGSAFWRGFAVFSGVYFALLLFHSGTWVIAALHEDSGQEPRRPCLVTAYAVAWAYDHLGGEEIRTAWSARVPAVHLLTVAPSRIPEYLDTSDLEIFTSNAQCALTVLFGVVGGCFASWLASTGAATPPRPRAEAPT